MPRPISSRDLRSGKAGRPSVGERALEGERDLAGGIGQGAIEVEQNGANRMHENRRRNDTGRWLAPDKGDSMHLEAGSSPRWLLGIVSGPALADTITVVTSFPSELTNAYKAAYEKKYPDDKVEILNKNTRPASPSCASSRPAAAPEIFWASAPDAFEVLKRRSCCRSSSAPTQRHPRQDRQLSDQRSRGLLLRPGARRLRHHVEHALHAGATSCRRPRNGPTSRSRSISATSPSRRRRAPAPRTSPSRPSCRAKAGTRAGTQILRDRRQLRGGHRAQLRRARRREQRPVRHRPRDRLLRPRRQGLRASRSSSSIRA